MKKFVNDRFCDNIDGSSYQYLHGRLISNTLKYLWEHVETKTENYNVFDDKKEGVYQHCRNIDQFWRQCAYANGKLEGEFKSWHKNGQLWEKCTYLNGKREGEHKTWSENGQLRGQWFYVNGVEQKTIKLT